MGFLENLGSLREPLAGVHLTASELREAILEKCALYRQKGIRPGMRAVLRDESSAPFFIELLALWELRCCVIPLSPRTSEMEHRNVLHHSGAEICIENGKPRWIESPELRIGSPDDALILYTSGTTGSPKGVVHTFLGLSNQMKTLGEHIPEAHSSVTLCLLSTSFGHGLICNSLFPLTTGRELVVFSPFAPLAMKLGEIIDQYDISFLSSVPALWRVALRHSAPPRKKTLRRVHSASAFLSSELFAQIQSWCPEAEVRNVYGTTETAGWIAATHSEPRGMNKGLVGHGWNAEFRIDGESQVWVKTGSVMRGYFQDEKLTRSVLSEGWFKTGDLGELHEGELYLKGRSELFINVAGTKVYPEEIETLLRRNPAILDVCAFGLPHPVAGEEAAVAITLQEPGKIGALPAIKAWYRKQISETKFPGKWFVLDAIPYTPRGKADRVEIRRICNPGTKDP